MSACLAEADVLDLASGKRRLCEDVAIEAHLAACQACGALVAAVLAAEETADPGPDAVPRNLEGRALGPYQLRLKIGAGGMGEVYRAWDERLGRWVAVKVLSARIADSPEQIRRLEREGRAAASITHPNVVTVHDSGSADGVPYIVSELIEGESLRSLIDRQGLARPVALELGLQLARGLAAAHGREVIHRDLNPRNIVITSDGILKILDFGLAKLAGPGAEVTAEQTSPGAVLGTAGYLSPEQARGEPAGPTGDLFAVGAILYEMLTGERAFDGATFAERLTAVLRDTPRRLASGELGEVGPVIARCLEKDPRRRLQSAQDLVFVLSGLIEGRPPLAPSLAPTGISRRRFLTGCATGVGGGVLAGAAAGVLASRGASTRALIPPSLTYRPLSFRHGRILTSRLTPDGSSLVYAAAWDEEPIAVFTQRLGGGGVRTLELPPADVLAVSSRGELALSLGRHFVEGLHTSGQLAVAPLERGAPRILADDVQDADFTPDGASLALVRRGGAGFRLELPAGHVLLETAGWLSCPRVSPDGTRVACLEHPSAGDDAGALVVVDRATRDRRALGGAWASANGVAWTRGGRALWLTAARLGGINDLHEVTLDGRERLLARTIGRMRLHDVAASGSAVLTQDDWRLRMMVGGAGRERDLSLSDISFVADVSADGKTLVFAELGDAQGTSDGAYLRPTAGGSALRLGDGMPLSLSADGRRLLTLLPGQPPRLVVHAIDAGEGLPLPLGEVASLTWARWAGGGRVVLGGAANGSPPRLWVLADQGTRPVPLTAPGVCGPGYVSPDGTQVAFITEDGRLLRVGVGAPAEAIVTPGRFPDQIVCGWHATRNEVFAHTRGRMPMRVHRIDPVTGRSAAHVEISPPLLGRRGLDRLVLSAAGDVYAYSYGQELSRQYLLEGA